MRRGKSGVSAWRWMVRLLPLLLVTASACAAQLTAAHMVKRPVHSTENMSGCRNGWRRVGTQEDPALRRTWAVVASCSHPAWPAHLEPASRWPQPAAWVPAGSNVVVASPESMTAMRLEARTVTPGRVGQTVTARLITGVRIRVKLTARDRAEMETVVRWRRGWSE